jgi:hypothetical protein
LFVRSFPRARAVDACLIHCTGFGEAFPRYQQTDRKRGLNRQHRDNIASDIKYADLVQSTPYMRLTLRNIGQRHGDLLLSYQLLARKRAAAYEPGGREFESLRARQIIQIVSCMPVTLSDPARYSKG